MPPEKTADVLDITGPALSATSDAPDAQQPTEAPALSEEVNTRERDEQGRFTKDLQVDKAPEAAEEGVTADPAAGKETTTAEAKPDRTPLEEKEFMRKAREATRAANERAAQAEAALARERQAKEPPPAPRPQRDQFADPDAYDTALVEWAGKQAATKAVAEAEARRVQEARSAQARSLTDTWKGHRDAFAADHPDYEEVAEVDDLPISIPMAHAIMTAGKDGPAVYYELGKHPDEAARISKLEPVQASVEIGRMAARLAAPIQAPRAPKPAPIKPLGSRSNAAAKSPDEMTTEEYAASIAHRLPFGRREARPN